MAVKKDCCTLYSSPFCLKVQSFVKKRQTKRTRARMGADDAADLLHQRGIHVQVVPEVVLDGLHLPQAGRITGHGFKVRVDAAQLVDFLNRAT